LKKRHKSAGRQHIPPGRPFSLLLLSNLPRATGELHAPASRKLLEGRKRKRNTLLLTLQRAAATHTDHLRLTKMVVATRQAMLLENRNDMSLRSSVILERAFGTSVALPTISLTSHSYFLLGITIEPPQQRAAATLSGYNYFLAPFLSLTSIFLKKSVNPNFIGQNHYFFALPALKSTISFYLLYSKLELDSSAILL